MILDFRHGTRMLICVIPYVCVEWLLHVKSSRQTQSLASKLYKKCERVVTILTSWLNKLWKVGYVPEEWCKANGVYIPKEEQSSTLGQFLCIECCRKDLFQRASKAVDKVSAGQWV